MRHRNSIARLGITPAHRKALFRGLITALFRHERITTTKPKAMNVKRRAEKMITRAKTDSVHNRRLIARDIQDRVIVKKLFTDIAPRYAERPGGYTRVLKLGMREGDAAEMVLLELVDRVVKTKKKREKKEKPKAKEQE